MTGYHAGKIILVEGEYRGTVEKQYNADGAIISNTSYLKDENPSWHSHENMHIALVFEDARSETKRAVNNFSKKGDIAFYHPDEMHRYTTSQPLSIGHNLEIPLSFMEKYSISDQEIKNTVMKKSFAKSLLLAMQSEMLFNNNRETKCNVLTLVLELISNSTRSRNEIPLWAVKLNDLLHDCWRETLSLTQLSSIVGVHPVTISKNFRSFYSCTLGEYKRRIKIENSLSLVKHSEMSLSEIAHYCEFADQSHFTRNFKKYTGQLPSDFRKF